MGFGTYEMKLPYYWIASQTLNLGGCTAGFAVHMINTQNDVLSRLDQIKVKALIATGTHDILTAESGIFKVKFHFFTKKIRLAPGSRENEQLDAQNLSGRVSCVA